MPNIFFKLQSWLQYYRQAETNHYLHSPLVFEIYKKVKDKSNSSIFDAEIIQNFAIDQYQIIENMRESEEKFQDWERQITDQKYNYTIDFGKFGLLISSQNGSPKQHFILK